MPFQDMPAPPMTPELYRQCQQAMHVLFADGHWLRAGRASLYILHTLGYRRTTALLGRWPWICLVEVGYRFVARHRAFFARWLFTRQ
jgi:prepilin-type processing-associated H-X9-DG protein